MEKQKQPYWLLVLTGVIIVGGIIAFSSSPALRDFLDDSPSNNTSTQPRKRAHVKITDWTNRPSASGNYQHVEGIVKSTGNITADYVKITVKAFDKNDKLVAIEQDYADPYILSPGEEGVFKVMMQRIPRMKKLSVSVKWE